MPLLISVRAFSASFRFSGEPVSAADAKRVRNLQYRLTADRNAPTRVYVPNRRKQPSCTGALENLKRRWAV